MLYFFIGLPLIFLFIFLLSFANDISWTTISTMSIVVLVLGEIIILCIAGSCWLDQPNPEYYVYVQFNGSELVVSEKATEYMYCEFKRASAWNFRSFAVTEYWLKKDSKVVLYSKDFNRIKEFFNPIKPGTVIFKVD